MKIRALLVLFLIICSCKEHTKEHEQEQKTDSIELNLDTYLTALTELREFNGVVLVYKRNKLLLSKAYNLNTDPSSTTYVTTDHQFDIHSISKLMTHYLIAELQMDEKITLSTTIDEFYPQFPNGDVITIEMLLNHSSGLPRELKGLKVQEINLSSDEIAKLAQKQELLFEPGTDIQYSNVGYELLYNIISKIYDKPFAQCLVDEIFIPLRMASSGTHFFSNSDNQDNPAVNHTLKDSQIVAVPNILDDEFKTARVYSTASDLHLFLEEIERAPYASAIQDDKGVISKDGGSKGIRAQVYSDLSHDFGYVLLANYDEMPFFKTVEDVAKILNEDSVEIPKQLNRQAITVDNSTLERYVGAYVFEDFDGLILKIVIKNDGLIVLQEGRKIATLKAESENVFFEDPKASESFTFVENEAGTHDALMGWKGIEVRGRRRK